MFPTVNRAGFAVHVKAGVFIFVVVFVFMLPGSVRAQKRIHTAFFEGTDYELNVYRIYGKEPGKTLMLIGGIQGDEPGGYLSADHYADTSLAKGNLIVVPRANFRSIVAKRRQINEDMNRKFAEDPKSNYETKVVVILKKLISESDCLLNLHDGSGFYSAKWEGPNRNPKRYGQSIIADVDTYVDPKTGKTIHLADMARLVSQEINKNIKNPRNHFHFNNHQTKEIASLHKEQRKSATYYALYTYGIPAFGIESSKSLRLEQKIRHHNLAINAFMDRLGIVPETPGIKLERPVLNYLVISINDSLPVVVKNRQSLSIEAGDTIMISHIESNYKRGLTADISGYGTVSDIRKKIRITEPTTVIVRKDYYACGSINIKITGGGKKIVADAAVSDPKKTGSGILLYKITINGDERIFENEEHVKLVKGDKFEIVDVISDIANPSELIVNLKGYVGDPGNNTGEDRGYVINTSRDLWKSYSLEKRGKYYQMIVENNGDIIGKLFFDLEDPVLKYVVIGTGNAELRGLTPGDTALVDADTPLKLFDISTNVVRNAGVKAFLAGSDAVRRPVEIGKPMAINNRANSDADKASCSYRLEIERDKIFLGSVTLNCSRETHNEK